MCACGVWRVACGVWRAACVHACMHACVRACLSVRACVRACVHACVSVTHSLQNAKHPLCFWYPLPDLSNMTGPEVRRQIFFFLEKEVALPPPSPHLYIYSFTSMDRHRPPPGTLPLWVQQLGKGGSVPFHFPISNDWRRPLTEGWASSPFSGNDSSVRLFPNRGAWVGAGV
jgi:hypothetical protein